MNGPSIRRLRAIIALIPILAITAAAQPRDFKLSPDKYLPGVPSEVRVQSAARIGATTLVAWGSRLTDAGGAHNAIVTQLVRGTSPVDSAAVLTAASARPERYVQVLPLRDRFLVLWGDVRSGSPVVYLSVVDTAGVARAERLFDRGAMRQAGIMLDSIAGGYRLYWSIAADGADSIRTCDVDATGAIARPPSTLAPGALTSVSHPYPGLGLTLLDRLDSIPILVDKAGTRRPLALSSTKLQHPYFIDRDGAVATIVGHTIYLYRSLFDSIPRRSLPIAFPPTFVESTQMPSIDSTGRLMVAYCLTIRYDGQVMTPMQRIVENDSGGFGPPATIGYVASETESHCTHFTSALLKRSFRRGEGNRYQLTLTLARTWMSNCQGDLVINRDTADVPVLYDGIGPIQVMAMGDSGHVPGAVNTMRIGSLDSSIVLVGIGAGVKLAVRAGRIAVNYPQEMPGIGMSGNTVMISWMTDGIDSIVTLGRMTNGGRSVDVTLNVELKPDTVSDQVAYTITPSFTSTGGRLYLTINSSWRAAPGYHTTGVLDRCAIYLARNMWEKLAQSENHLPGQTLLPFPSIYKADEGTVMTAIGTIDSSGWTSDSRVVVVDTLQKVRLSVDSIPFAGPGPMAVLPLFGDKFAIWAGDGIHHFRRRVFYERDPLPIVGASPRFIMLGRGRILAYAAEDALEMAIFDTTGRVLYKAPPVPVTARTAESNVFAVRNPADSGFIVLMGGAHGITMTTFDQRLNLIAADLPVSAGSDSAAGPAAVYFGDSLIVVWTDYRNGVSDIYGTIMKVSTPASVADPVAPAAAAAIRSISPNPARELAVVTFAAPQGRGAIVRLIDPLGRPALDADVPAGAASVALPTTGLATGYYLVQVVAGGRASKPARLLIVN